MGTPTGWDRLPQDISIPSTTDEAHRIQQGILELLEAHRFSDRDIFAIKLAIEEAIVNAIKHGNQMDPNKRVHISFRVDEDVFYIRVRDEGSGFDPDQVPDPTQEEYLERPSGRGLLLMRHYMNEVHFLEGGTVVFMWKRRNGSK